MFRYDNRVTLVDKKANPDITKLGLTGAAFSFKDTANKDLKDA